MILDIKSYKLSPLLSVTGIILLNAFFGWYNMRSRKLSLIGFETEYANRLHLSRLKQQKQLLGAISYELNRPLCNIDKKIKTVKNIYSHQDLRKYLDKIESASKCIASIINVFMVFDQERKTLDLKICSLNNIYDNLNNDLIEMNLDSKVKFTLESNSNISFYGDELLIHQI